MPEILTFLALEQTKVKFRTKYLYSNNQQKIIFQISLIFFKSGADSWSTFLVSEFESLNTEYYYNQIL